MNIGIIGNTGFVGSYLKSSINYINKKHKIINFEKSFFIDEHLIDNFVQSCDVIVHLAGVNRSDDPEKLYATNVGLTTFLINSLNRTKSRPLIIFASSTQEDLDNPYGKSKLFSRNLLIKYSKENKVPFTGLIIPNVFGPFGKPNYNSVIATFSYKLVNNESPIIYKNSILKLIYIEELVDKIIDVIENNIINDKLIIDHTKSVSVSEILEDLVLFNDAYLKKGIIPSLLTKFKLNLFNTFRSFINYNTFYPQKYIKNIDDRGSFTELIKLDIGMNGQISFSTTKPLITRGNHFHTRKIERFSVIKGDAIIRLRRIGDSKIVEYKLSGDTPMFVDIPIWTTHNITNIGSDDLYTIFWINELYNPLDADTFFENV